MVDNRKYFSWTKVAAGMVAHGRMEPGFADRWPLLLGLFGWMLMTAGWVGLTTVAAIEFNREYQPFGKWGIAWSWLAHLSLHGNFRSRIGR
ncbi:MAG: hypothetical protein R3C56_39855 [Pirellulaceae bacterium]